MKKLIILSDYGLDDAAAGAYLIGRRQMFGGIDIVAVGGNVGKELSLNNALRLVAALEKESGPMNGVRVIHTLSIPQEFAALPAVHGGDGMGDITLDCAAQKKPLGFGEWRESLTGGEIILSLGPLTVTRLLLKKIGSRQNNVRRVRTASGKLIIMAGLVNAVPNFMGAEFNQALDMPAYNECLAYPHAVATLDTCRRPEFNLAGRRFNESVLGKLVNRACALAEARHADNAYIYDLIASLYLTRPQIFKPVPKPDPWGNLPNELELTDPSFSLAALIESETQKKP
ncbi:MAG: nucleoside hydrolase [Clostridiales bacterium]|jgi:inosine-uridine nucleoside N-ribohydrolase|nr:nucleoside hydrolase [Clostridiales bacterium]